MTGSASTSLTLSRISFDSDSGSAVVVLDELVVTATTLTGVTIATCGVEFGVLSVVLPVATTVVAVLLIAFVDKSAKVEDSVVPATTVDGMTFKTCMIEVDNGNLGATSAGLAAAGAEDVV